MKLHETIKRYYLIINTVSGANKPRFEEIRSHLSNNDFDVSRRTLQRDLNNIRYEFGIEIKYDRFSDGYYIDREESPDIDYFMRFFEMSILSGTITDSLKEGVGARDYISFDTNESLVGVEYINPILFAIKNRKKIRIKYQRFISGSPYDAVIKPGLLKESQKRWYVVGVRDDINELRTYGLDRVKGLEILNEKYNPKDVRNVKGMYDHVLGITYLDRKKEKVLLKVTPFVGNYFKTLPWHNSQKVIRDNEKEFLVQFELIPNFELEQKILGLGKDVEIQEPKWLRLEMKKIYSDILKIYS